MTPLWLPSSLIVLVLLCCGTLVVSDGCESLSATFSHPQICYPSYAIQSAASATNGTGGDAIAASLLAAHPTKSCAQAYAAYYCNVFYPECNVTHDVCYSVCSAVVSACANDVSSFTPSGLPLPTNTYCETLYTADCSSAVTTNLTEYYIECEAFNSSQYRTTPIGGAVCFPDYTVPVANLSYSAGEAIQTDLMKFTENADEEFSDDMYPCLKAFANFRCADVYPQCPVNGEVPVQRVCASLCRSAVTLCSNASLVDFFPDGTFPTTAECDTYPESNCFTPVNNTYLGYYFGADPPNDSPTTSTSSAGSGECDDCIVYPPGGPARGGAIGAAMLVGILGFIGVLMLIMKKQDTR